MRWLCHQQALPLFLLPPDVVNAASVTIPDCGSTVCYLLRQRSGVPNGYTGYTKFPEIRQSKSIHKSLLNDVMDSAAAFELEQRLPSVALSGRVFAEGLEARFEQNCTAVRARQHKRLWRKLSARQPRHTVCFRDDTNRNALSSTESSVSCTTFNIQAPIYKRVNSEGCRESHFRESWLGRNQNILQMLLSKQSSIICLQEFWLGNEELVELYEDSLREAGYEMHKLPRTNNRGDGLLTAIKSDRLRIFDYRELLFYDCGDRVAQFLHLQSRISFQKRCYNTGCNQELLLVNTHLLFPHNSNFCLIRLRQVYKIIEFLEEYKMENKLPFVPVILCGDWNGSKRGHVYKFLRSQGFISCYDAKHRYSDSDADAHRWVSHRNHRGNICGVDFIWLMNPSKCQKSLSLSWNESVFSLIKAKLEEMGLRGRDAFSFFKSQQRCGDHVTMQEFQQALHALNLTGHHLDGLTREEIEDLMQTADLDGNGVIDFHEFQKMVAKECGGEKDKDWCASEENNFVPSCMKVYDYSRHTAIQNISNSLSSDMDCNISQGINDAAKLNESRMDILQRCMEGENSWLLETGTELDVEDASLFPPEVEEGRWPDDYSLSDHAPLTAVFTPVRVRR